MQAPMPLSSITDIKKTYLILMEREVIVGASGIQWHNERMYQKTIRSQYIWK